MGAVLNNTETVITHTTIGARDTIYTASSAGSIVVRVDFVNYGGSTATVSFTFGGNSLVTTKAIPPQGTVGVPNQPSEPWVGCFSPIQGGAPFFLKSGQTLEAYASAASTIQAIVHAIDLS